MPGRIYTPLPEGQGHLGERQFAERVVELGNERTHLWAGVDYLPGGVPDIDAVLVQEDIGSFNIEIKAVSLEMVEQYGLNICQIKGRSAAHHPVAQAGVAQLGLRQYFGSVSRTRCPFFFATAAFSRIQRAEMLQRFDSPQLRLQFEGMLFADDLQSQQTFLSRLMEIRRCPPRGKPARDPRPNPGQLQATVTVLSPGTATKSSEADKARGSLLADNVGRPGRRPAGGGPAKKYLEPGTRVPVIFRGAPGTGKTVQLQEIAVAHARAGRAVLFTCYNKVLASTLRGILATQDLGEAVDKRIVITHVDELHKQLADEDLDAFRGLFGTVCVDEAQDVAQEKFDFLSELAGEDAEWFLADGQGQELYGGASEFLIQSRERGTIEVLRRNFRNSSAGFLVAQSVFEHGPDVDAIQKWIAERPLKPSPGKDGQLELGLPTTDTVGELPRIVRYDRSGKDWQHQRVRAIVSVLHEDLEQLAAEGKRRDLAVICAQGDSKSNEPGAARSALELLGVPVHDQITTTNRGAKVPDGHVRLVTIHSARGIEASRVVLLGMDQGISANENHQMNSRIMSYIALSRAQIGTTIVVPEASANPYLAFIEKVVESYSVPGE